MCIWLCVYPSVGQKWTLHRTSCPFTSIQVNPSVVFDSLQSHSVIFGHIRKFPFMMNPSGHPSQHHFTNIQLYSEPFQNPISLHVNPSIFEQTLHISSHKFIYPSTKTLHLKPFRYPFNLIQLNSNPFHIVLKSLHHQHFIRHPSLNPSDNPSYKFL